MFKGDSQKGASSQGDRTFDIKYKLDISDRKGKTGQTFKQQQGFQFEDFKDFRQDKSQKSYITSQRKVLPSELAKRSQQSFTITQNATQMSIKRKGGSIAVDEIKHTTTQENQEAYFANQNSRNNQQRFYKTVTSSMHPRRQQQSKSPRLGSKFSLQQPMFGNTSPLNVSNRSQKQITPSQYVSPRNQFKPQFSYNVSESRQKTPTTNRMTPQIEYKDILASINYYENENQKLDYQTMKLMNQIERYQKLIQENPMHQHELIKLTDQTNTLNTMISNQRSLQRTLIQNYKMLEEQYDQVVLSIDGLKFDRPAVIKDQTKAIIDEINSLKAEFQSLKRDEGSLNLSNTIHNPYSNNPPSLEQRISFLPEPSMQSNKNFNPEDRIMRQFISEIVQISNKFPNYIYNTKMMAIKDQWKIFENSQICVNCSTRDYPMLEFRIGNKTAKNLNDFLLKEGATFIAQKQMLSSKNYYVHSYKMTKLSQPFLKMELGYKSGPLNPQSGGDSVPKNFVFFIPTLPVKHGEFIPITKKQYQKQHMQHMNVLQEVVAFEKPLDTTIIRQDISQFLLYYPTLLYEKNEKGQGVCKGIFRLWNSSQGSLVKIKQRGATVSIYIKNNIPFLLQSLEFLLTTLI